jgi:hypothetical protein
MIPTILPNIKPQFEAIALETTGKATEKFEVKYFAKEQIVCKRAYNTHTYNVGDEIGGTFMNEGLHQYDGYVNNVIPWDKITTKTFCTVREYKTTVFEIVDK